jgi:hypothetical protein
MEPPKGFRTLGSTRHFFIQSPTRVDGDATSSADAIVFSLAKYVSKNQVETEHG